MREGQRTAGRFGASAVRTRRRLPIIAALAVLAPCTAALLSSSTRTAFAQQADRAGNEPVPEAVDDLAPLLKPVLEKYKLPALAAAIVRGRRTIGLGAVGVRQLGSPEQVAIDDRFHLGSCTKSITATLCARLVERGKLSWDTTIAQVFPELVGAMHSSYGDVTLEQLLTHRGGVPHDVPKRIWQKLWAHRGSPTQARQLLLEQTIREKPQATPGTTYIYSNAGVSIAGHMAERATGESWEDLVAQEIFKPLAMAGAGFGAPGSPDVLDQPRGHTKLGRPIKPGPWGQGDNPIAIGPANSVHCSIGDWAKYVAIHLRGAQADAAFLKPDTFAKLHTPADGPGEKYALGWLVTSRDWGGGGVLTHFGSNTMWSAVTWIAPQRNFAVLVVCNHGGPLARKATDEAIWQLIQYHIEQRGP